MMDSKVYSLILVRSDTNENGESEYVMGIYKRKEDAVVALMVCALSDVGGDAGIVLPDTTVAFYQESGNEFSMDEHRGNCTPPEISNGVVRYGTVSREYFIREHSVK